MEFPLVNTNKQTNKTDKLIMKQTNIRIAFLASAVALLGFAQAATVNVDFGADNGGAAENYTGVGVAPDLGTTWNHFNATAMSAFLNLSNAALVDSTGAATGISLSFASTNQRGYNTGSANNLLVDYLYNEGNSTSTVNLTGLTPNSAFSLYLYGNGDNNIQSSTFTLNAFNGGATGRTFGSDRSNINNTFVKLDGTANGSGNVSFTWTAAPSTSAFGPFNGFQLQTVPEPSAALLGGLGLLALLRRRR
jgi:PEP-CTERM motif